MQSLKIKKNNSFINCSDCHQPRVYKNNYVFLLSFSKNNIGNIFNILTNLYRKLIISLKYSIISFC